MSQLQLIADNEWTATELLMTLHAKVDRLQEDQQHMSRMLATVLAAVQDDPATLHKLIRGLSVVPFEDEAVPAAEPIVQDTPATPPALAHCHTCDKNAYTEEQVEDLFGYRTPAGRETIVQSWCRSCRALEAKTSPRKKPTYWSKMCPIAQGHNAAVMTCRKKLKKLKAKLATHLSPSERAETESRIVAEQQILSKQKSAYNNRIAELGYVHPNKAKRAAAKATK